MYIASVANLAGISACVTDRRERYIASISLLNPTFANDKFEAALARLCAADEAEPPPPAEPEPPPRAPYVDPVCRGLSRASWGALGRKRCFSARLAMTPSTASGGSR
jgi:hypothetical protein